MPPVFASAFVTVSPRNIIRVNAAEAVNNSELLHFVHLNPGFEGMTGEI